MQQIALLVIIALFFNGIQSKTTAKPASSDHSPVHDVLQVLPINRVEEIEQAHLKNDDGFKAAVLYLQGEEWKQLVNNIVKSSEYQKFDEMAAKYKMNITQAIKCMRTHLDSLKVVPTKVTSKPNLEPFITDIQKELPIGELAKVLADSNNPEAKRVRQEISSKENQIIAENLHNLQDMVKIREILKGMNFDVEPYIALVYTFLGWVH